MSAQLRRALRLVRVVLHLFTGLAVALYAAGSKRPERAAQFWFRGLNRILGLSITVEGAAAPGPLLLAGNHISWLDISVVVAVHPVIFVSKSEVARWPLIGWMARAGGTRFIERGAHGTVRLNAEIRQMLQAGHPMVIFPEGTTTTGRGVKHFQARLFAGAIEAGVPVQPFALQYAQDCAPYVGDDVMFWHLLRLLREPVLEVRLSFGPAQPAGDNRKAIAARMQDWVARRLAAAPVQSSASSGPVGNTTLEGCSASE